MCRKNQYYVNTYWHFGDHSAPFFSTRSPEWILRDKYNLTHLIHYLDKRFHFLQGYSYLLPLAVLLNAPVAKKTVDGSTTLLHSLGAGVWLHLPGDSSPPPPRQVTGASDGTPAVGLWKEVTKWQLPSLINKLVFAARVVLAGQLFIHHTICLNTTNTHRFA